MGNLIEGFLATFGMLGGFITLATILIGADSSQQEGRTDSSGRPLVIHPDQKKLAA